VSRLASTYSLFIELRPSFPPAHPHPRYNNNSMSKHPSIHTNNFPAYILPSGVGLCSDLLFFRYSVERPPSLGPHLRPYPASPSTLHFRLDHITAQGFHSATAGPLANNSTSPAYNTKP
jgi:hypothetical protein